MAAFKIKNTPPKSWSLQSLAGMPYKDFTDQFFKDYFYVYFYQNINWYIYASHSEWRDLLNQPSYVRLDRCMSVLHKDAADMIRECILRISENNKK